MFYRFSIGMNCFGLLDDMRNSPNGFKTLFKCCNKPLSASILLDDIFEDVHLPDIGTNARIKENDVWCFWRGFVLDVAGKVDYN